MSRSDLKVAVNRSVQETKRNYRVLAGSKVFNGGNVYYRSSVIRQKVDLRGYAKFRLADCRSDALESLVDALTEVAENLTKIPKQHYWADEIRSKFLQLPEQDLVNLLFVSLGIIDNMVRRAMRYQAPIEWSSLKKTSDEQRYEFLWSTQTPTISRLSARLAVAVTLSVLPTKMQEEFRKKELDVANCKTKLLEKYRRSRLPGPVAVQMHLTKLCGVQAESMGNAYVRIGEGVNQRVICPITTNTMDDFELDDDVQFSTSSALQLEPGSPKVRLYRIYGISKSVLGVAEVLERRGDSSEYFCNITSLVHPDFKILLAQIFQTFGDRFLMVELLSGNIRCAPEQSGFEIVRMTSNVDFSPCILPNYGARIRRFSRESMELLCGHTPLPMAIIFGNQSVKVNSAIESTLRAAGKVVGLARAGNAFISGAPVLASSMGRQGAVRYVLSEPRVEAFVNVKTDQEILRRGLEMDQCAVAVAIAPEQSVDYSSAALMVAETSAQGVVVMSVQHPMAMDLIGTSRASKYIFVDASIGTSFKQTLGHQHVSSGGSLVRIVPARKGLFVEIRSGCRVTFAVHLHDHPPNMEETLIAFATALALGVPAEKSIDAISMKKYFRS